MANEVKRPKAKRKLSDINFEHEGGHVALVSKDQGGGANGHNYALVLKANNFSEEFIQKMQQIRVTMELPEFLRKFFGMYYEEAEILAAMLGYQKPETEEVEFDYDDYIESKLEAFEILKSAYESESIPDFLSKIEEEQYLAMLKDQEKIEKAFKKAEKQSNESSDVAKAAEVDTSIAGEVHNEEVSASENNQELEKSTMTQKTEQVTEMVEKSALEAIQKAFEEQKQALEKANQLLAQFEAEKKAAIEKARKEEIVAAVKDEAKAEVLFKAVKDAADEDFKAVVKALGDLVAVVEKSALFQEQGASVETEEPVKESPVAKLLKAKLQAGK